MGAGTGGSSLFYLASLSHADVCLKRSLLLSKLREKKEESWGPGKSVNPQHQNLSPRLRRIAPQAASQKRARSVYRLAHDTFIAYATCGVTSNSVFYYHSRYSPSARAYTPLEHSGRFHHYSLNRPPTADSRHAHSRAREGSEIPASSPDSPMAMRQTCQTVAVGEPWPSRPTASPPPPSAASPPPPRLPHCRARCRRTRHEHPPTAAREIEQCL